MDPKAYARLYQGDSADARYFNARLGIILDMVQGVKQGKALDVGCGPGIMARNLIDRNWQVVGLDSSAEMIEECVESIGICARSDFKCGSVEQMPFMDSTFSVVVAMGVLEYIKDVNVALSELARVAKEDGMVVMTMMNKTSPFRIWERRSFKKKTQTSWIYSEKEFISVCENNGLEVLEVVYYDFNLFPSYLKAKMPQRIAKLNLLLEPFYKKYLKQVGSGFIVKTRKKH